MKEDNKSIRQSLSEEEAKQLLDEGLKLREKLKSMFDEMHRFTPEDLLSRVK